MHSTNVLTDTQTAKHLLKSPKQHIFCFTHILQFNTVLCIRDNYLTKSHMFAISKHWPSFIKRTYGRKTCVRPFPLKLRHLSIWTWAGATIKVHVRSELVYANLSLCICGAAQQNLAESENNKPQLSLSISSHIFRSDQNGFLQRIKNIFF